MQLHALEALVYFQGIMHSPDMLQETSQLFTWPKSARTFESNCRKAWLGSISEHHHHHQNTLWCKKPCNVFQRHTLCLDTRWGPTNVVPIINYPRTKQLLTKPGVYVTGGAAIGAEGDKVKSRFSPPGASSCADNSNGGARNCTSYPDPDPILVN